MKFQISIDEQILDLTAEHNGKNFTFHSDDRTIDTDFRQLSPHSFSLILDGKSHIMAIHSHPQGFRVTVDQHTNIISVKDESQLLLERFGFSDSSQDHTGEIHAQIPGLISKFFVVEGDTVEKGQKLFILEAMKMENEIESPLSGTIKSILIEKGVSVEKGLLIMEIENK